MLPVVILGLRFFTAVNIKTGRIAFQDRRFPKSNFVLADGKLILLDEDGNLVFGHGVAHGSERNF